MNDKDVPGEAGGKDGLKRGVEVVTFVLGAFSGSLGKIAPPDETGAAFAVGIVSFAMLVILLIIMALAKGKLKAQHKKYWLSAAACLFIVFLSFAYIYDRDRARLTFFWPPEEEKQELYVGAGDDNLTPKAREAKAQHPELTAGQLVAGFGGIEKRRAVWPAEAIESAGRKLKVDYVILVLSLATSIFCLTEGILARDSGSP